MTNPIDPNLSPVRRDALVRAHRAGHRYPALWNDWLRAPLIADGLLEEVVLTYVDDDGQERTRTVYPLTDAGVEYARREAEGRE
jgi:hypothetical protein